MIAKTGLLIVTNPVQISKILPTIGKQVKNTLYIHLINALHEPFGRYRSDIFTSAPKYSQTIRGIYSEAAAICQNLDVRVFLSGLKYSTANCLSTSRPIDVVIFDKLHDKEHVDSFLKSCVPNKMPDCTVLTLENNEAVVECGKYAEQEDSKECKHTVLGGTFDRLHTGHKILLTEAILRAKEKVTVGVTDTNMLSAKILWELIEPCKVRLESVKNFLNDVCPELDYNVVPIQDPFGPTQSDPTMEIIVVSAETLRGGVKVNEIRQNKGLPTLEIVNVELVDCPDRQENEEEKISSSTNRIRLLGTLLQPVKVKVDENKPYVIGLTGGICSGKSNISVKLAKLGAAVIDCDKVAHDVYSPGKPCHKIIHETFGSAVIDEKGEINRRALGAIVFHNKNEMQRLNSIVWPAIAEETINRIYKLHEAGHKVVVIEAAVLLQAGWDSICHEVWSCIIPPDEAIKRLINRNKLSEEDAKARLASQPPNTEQISKANVVFCSLWSFEFTQMTVERAWSLLKERLPFKCVN